MMRLDRPRPWTWLRSVSLLCLTVGGAAAAETRIDFDRLSIDEGLSQSIVEQILQDRQGFMWFVTEDGLNRFDGYTFTVYRNVAGDPSSLSHNELKSIFEDGSGILWVGAFEGGLNRWTRQLAASAAIPPATVWPATPSTRWSSTPQPAT